MSNASHRRTKRVRFAPIAIGSGALAAVLLSLSLTGTLSAFTAQITNSANSASAGTLSMQEVGTATIGGTAATCNSTDAGTLYGSQTATCATINKFGGSTTMIPGQTVTQTVTIKNTGTVTPTTFTLTPGATCTATGTGTGSATTAAICGAYSVVITDTTTAQQLYTGTIANLAGKPAIAITTPPAGGITHSFSFAVTLASSSDNTFQGTGVSMPLVWNFSS